MEYVKTDSISRSTKTGKTLGFLSDIVSVFRSAISIEPGVSYYRRYDKIRSYVQWCEMGTNKELGIEDVKIYEVWVWGGKPTPGYTYDGNGLYTKNETTYLFNGIPMRDYENIP